MLTLIYILRAFRICIGYQLDCLVLPKLLAPSTYLFFFVRTEHRQQIRQMNRGQRLRHALECLGPMWVKFGQLISTRYDVLPNDVIEALVLLQDSVTPFSERKAELMICNQLKKPFEEVFEVFEKTPLASASIAQVHAARLKQEGIDVVVKILRPNIHKKIKRDLTCLYTLARMIAWLASDAERLKPVEVVRELERSLNEEVNLLSEAANATTLKRHFPERHPLLVPDVYWDYSTKEMMVMERIDGVNISHIDTLKEKKVDLEQLAKLGVELFFTQVLRDSFFHADMHPGNVFVDVSEPNRPGYIVVDFGIVGTLNPEDQRYIAENLLAFFNRDYRRVAVLHVESGWVPSDTRIDQFESAIRTVCEPIFARPLKDISFGLLFMQLLKTARRFKTEIQPQLILLQKTLLSVESLGRRLYPELDLWETAKPQLEKWVGRQVGIQGLLQKSKERMPLWLENMPELPDLMYRWLVMQNKTGQLKQQVLTSAPKNHGWGYVFIGIFIGIGLLFFAEHFVVITLVH